MRKKSRRIWKLLGLAIVVGFVMSKWGGCTSTAQKGSRDMLVNRLWVHHMPKNDRDLVNWMALRDKDRKRIGGVGFSSQWRGVFEHYRWDLSGDKLKVNFPQNKIRAEVHVRAWDCKKEAPKPFDYCLELKQGIRLARFYSKKDWKLENGKLPSEFARYPQLLKSLSDGPSVNMAEVPLSPLPNLFFAD